MKNFLTATMLSAGMPMMLMGDEVRRTQGGNNNAYCQDNETTWFDWSLVEKHAGLHRFVSMLNARRTSIDTAQERERVSLGQLLRQAAIMWHLVKLFEPDWSASSQSVAFTALSRRLQSPSTRTASDRAPSSCCSPARREARMNSNAAGKELACA